MIGMNFFWGGVGGRGVVSSPLYLWKSERRDETIESSKFSPPLLHAPPYPLEMIGML